MSNDQSRREGETVDGILGGCFHVLQNEKGYRFSIDALLLSYFTRSSESDILIDLGTGSGIICLILAGRGRCRQAVGIDIQDDLVDMARRTMHMNELAGRINIMQGDVKDMASLVDEESFDWAVFNPPYRRVRSGRINPDRQKAVARHEIKGTLIDFLKAAHFALKKSGRMSVIYPATRLVELMAGMRLHHLEPKRLQVVHSNAASPGEFVLVEGFKGGREELEVLPPLFIYEEHGKYTKELSTILNGCFISP